MDSILDDIKKPIGLDAADTSFDADIIMHINSAFFALKQLGVGPTQTFSIKDNTSKWSDFFGSETTEFEAVKSYIYLKVKLIFDPPTSSTVLDSLTRIASETESRLMMEADAISHPYIPTVIETEDIF
jgi:hypothetical protein